jgi:hypothetical protein
VARVAFVQPAAFAGALLVSGCGGGTALLHPAHTLPTSRVSVGAGMQGNFVFGDADERIAGARAAVASGGAVSSPEEEQAYAEGAVAHVLFAPGLAPWVGARAGIGYETEAGLTYTGRSARIDARHAFETEEVALSAGAGLSAVLSRRGATDDDPTARDQAVPGLDPSPLSGWVVDVPILVGWRSNAELVQVWGGVRGGYERVLGDVILRVDLDPDIEDTASFDASRWYGSGIVGMMVSIDPVWVGVELATTFGRASGELAIGGSTLTGKSTALSLSPAAAIGGRF